MRYKYVGVEPCYIGAAKITLGTVMEFAQDPGKLWVPVEEPSKPKPEPARAAATKG